MKIIIVPETESERKNFQTVEHTGVREYFIFGNKLDTDGDVADFHDWKGSYRYLVSNLTWFYREILEEQQWNKRKGQKVSVPVGQPQTINLDPNSPSHSMVSPEVLAREGLIPHPNVQVPITPVVQDPKYVNDQMDLGPVISKAEAVSAKNFPGDDSAELFVNEEELDAWDEE